MVSIKLGDVIDFKNGKSIKQSEGTIPIYGGNGILGYSDSSNFEHTLIVGRVGAYCGSIHIERGICWVSDNAIAGVPKGENDLTYLYYVLKSLNLNKKQIGSSQPLLTQQMLRDMSVDIEIDIFKQKQISRVLQLLDYKISLNDQINDQLESMAKTLYDYWFVQFDFPDENGKLYKSSGGKMVYNDQLKREIPEGWEVRELSEIANIVMGQSPAGDSYNEIAKGTVFFQGSTDFGWRFPKIRQYTTKPSRIAKEDDILLSVRAPVGTLNIAEKSCCIGRGLAALNSKDGVNSYLFHVMQNFKSTFDFRNTVGTTFGSITKDDLFSLSLSYPKLEILISFDCIVSKYNKEIKIRSKQNQELTQLRDWLLPMLMNGQVR